MVDDKLFAYVMAQVKLGRDWEDYVAKRLSHAGIPAEASNAPVIETRTEKEWGKLADEKDVTIAGQHRLEVKSRDYTFRGPSDYPFKSVMVSTVRSWHNKVQRPLAVAVVSQHTGAIFFIPEWTEPHWEKVSRYDKRRGYDVLNYECPKPLLWRWDSYIGFLHDYLLSHHETRSETMSASLNRVIILGNLTRDPELKATQSGMSICELGVAVNERTKKPDGTWGERVNFFDVVTFGKTAENCVQYLAKGRQVAVEGRLRWESWTTNDGQKRSRVTISADNVQFIGSAQGQQAAPAPKPLPEHEPLSDDLDDDIPF